MPEKKYNPLLLVVIYGDIALYGFVSSMRGVTFPLIKNGFGASYYEQGLMTALISFVAVCFCVIPGMFMSRFGLKKTIASGFIVMSLGMASLYLASSFWMAAALLLILQAGFGFFEIGLNGMGVRIFTVRSGLMLNFLHFFFGFGAIGGPRLAGFLINKLGLSWQHVYPIALIPVFILFAVSMIAQFPGKMKNEEAVSNQPEARKTETAPDQISIFRALKEPMVWIFGLIMGFVCSIEACSISWSGLYLQDVFGLDPATTGAAFVSAFFLLYSLSRLFGGFFIEKIGYVKVTIAASFITTILLLASFCLGRPGIYLLPVSGIFIALPYPTILAVSIGVFKEKAQAMSPAIISIAFVLNGLAQFGFGISNRFIGAAWAYRSCVLYGIVLIILSLKLRSMMKNLKTAVAH
ncbi:MFS transporter [Leadbettera azotonutricia]|uniref:Putative major facilitator superfamily MFS_1 n=1 Tax=Leadbettera azotonutricia (strain ATCC BAA-888 / DSM 13862 / ZAS-9) TaxID=545695 RepID=F5YD25_LEAAZ|nr:MFS transporter [Leadbettera azotonutricia]AEF80720.1 putative major facilitator superfamily MFS_1 [Leadbettera azotonutricia ZAS-9]